MAQTKAPDAAVVEQAQDKIEAGDDLSKREAAALEAQAEIDRQRGYTREEWKPGIWQYRSLVTGHTAPTEYEIVQYHAGLENAGIVDSR
jgi:hypothetical protein